MSELHDALDRATDAITAPGLAAVALADARRRRARRRGVVAAAVSSAVVVAVVVGVVVADPPAAAPPAGPATPTTSATTAMGVVEQPEWDPRGVDDLPSAPDDVAPALPDVIDPPDSSPAIGDDPVEAAVLVVEEDGVAQVLGVDGGWRTVALDGDNPSLSLSPGGTRLVVSYYGEYDEGPTVHDLTTGARRELPFPEDYTPFDFTAWSFVDDDRLFLAAGDRGWAVDATTGAAEAYPHRVGGLSTTVDPAGALLRSADFGTRNVLTDHAGGTAREVTMSRTGRLSHLQADGDTVAGTTYDGRPFSVVVADRATLTPRSVLPVRDPEANYSNGGLGVLALTGDDTVLLSVAVIGRDRDGFRVVAWEPGTGALSVVSTTDVSVEGSVSFAQGLLRAGPQAEHAGPGSEAGAPPIDPDVVQERWDPATVADLPWAEGTPYPRSLDPAGTPVTEQDATPVVAAVDDGDAISRWHASGARTEVERPEPPYQERSGLALSPDGARLGFAGRTAVWISTDGDDWVRHDYPDDFRTAPDWGVSLVLDATGGFALHQAQRAWQVTGAGVVTRLGGQPYDLAPTPDGVVVGFTFGEPAPHRGVVELAGGARVSDVESSELQSLNRPAASDGLLAAVRGVGSWGEPRDATEQNGLVALERRTLVTRAYLPIRDPGYGYTDGGNLAMLAWLDADSAVGHVVTGGYDDGTRHLFSWDTATGALRRVSELPASLTVAVASAPSS